MVCIIYPVACTFFVLFCLVFCHNPAICSIIKIFHSFTHYVESLKCNIAHFLMSTCSTCIIFNNTLADSLTAVTCTDSVTEVTECWVVDVNDEVPPPCVNKASDGFFSSNEELLNDAFSVHQLCSVGEAGIQLPEVAISELESLLMMESEGEIIGGADYITVNADELEPVHENTGTQFDFVHHDMEEVPATVSYDVDEDQSTSLEEDDSRDMTWSYRRSTRRKCLRRRHRQLRSKSVRRLSRNSTMDERKKLQNKSAATRYREKKRSEEIENEMLCVELEKRNKELRSRVQDMTQEVAVLRQLVIDIFRSPTTCSA